MKWMQWILVLALGAGIGLAGLGCDSDSSSSDRDPLVGTWRAQTFNGQTLGDTVSLVVTFRNNGSLEMITTIEGNAETDTGTWSADDGVITVVSDGETDRTPYSVDGDTLTMGDPGEVFVFTR
ncbi:MAG: lipocalin family protein [Kiritimatiellae bacterium]|nr:lipocalin family protein [Kiritimatiellia bacterium]MDD4341772.1 lipocalin family protein [Kiritimatiellia bacterium]